MKHNLVPIDEIGPVIRELIEERWPHGSGYEVLAEKIGYDASAIYGIAMVERATADFDLVDKTLCGLGRPDLWWGRFAHVYPTKFLGKCELPSCNKTFPEFWQGHVRRYCSKQCKYLAQGVREQKRPGTRNNKRGLCLRGHKLTPDNLLPSKIGARRCRECNRMMKRERNRRYNERRRARAA